MECYKSIVDVEVISRGLSLQEKIGILLTALNGRERGVSNKKTETKRVFDEIYDISANNEFMNYLAWINFKLVKIGKNKAVARFILLPLELAWKLQVLVKDFESRLRLIGDTKTKFSVSVKQMSFKVNHPIYRETFEYLVGQGVVTSQIEGGNFMTIPIAIKVGVKSVQLKPSFRLTGQGENHSCNLEFTLSNIIRIDDLPIPDTNRCNNDRFDIGNDRWIREIGMQVEPYYKEIMIQIEHWANYREIELPDSYKNLIGTKMVLVNRFPTV